MDFNITEWNRISEDAFNAFGYNSGILVKNFDPTKFETPKDEDILCTTTGNITASLVPAYQNLGDDVNGIQGEYAELQIITAWTATMGFTALEINPQTLKLAAGAADITGMSVKARMQLMLSDFDTVALIMTRLDGGLTAAVLYNALSTGGVNLTTSKGGKVNNAMTLTGYQKMSNQSQVPMEFYSAGGDVSPDVILDRSNITLEEGETAKLNANVIPSGTDVEWNSDSDSNVEVKDGVITAIAEGSANIMAKITVEGKPYTDTCKVTVTSSGV